MLRALSARANKWSTAEDRQEGQNAGKKEGKEMKNALRLLAVAGAASLLASGSALAACGAEGCAVGADKQVGCGSGKAAACKAKAACAAKSGCGAAKAAEEAGLSTSALKVLLASGVDVAVFDARTGKYDDGRRIPGAGSLSATASEEEVAAAIPSKDALVVTYCTNLKCPASSMLAGRLKELGYKNVLEYPHGIEGWAGAGNEVVNTGN
ncbi:rhodanese-like domain-containing protein [Verrucomicrobiota bacterium]